MIITSGAWCDICDNPILPIDEKEKVHAFKVKGIENDLHCDNKCKVIINKAVLQNDWKILPKGRLRNCFEKAETTLEK